MAPRAERRLVPGSIITGLEERFGVVVDDDDIDGATFATVGTLADFVSSKLPA